MSIKRFLRNKDIGELRAERPHQARIGTGVSVCGGRKGQQVEKGCRIPEKHARTLGQAGIAAAPRVEPTPAPRDFLHELQNQVSLPRSPNLVMGHCGQPEFSALAAFPSLEESPTSPLTRHRDWTTRGHCCSWGISQGILMHTRSWGPPFGRQPGEKIEYTGKSTSQLFPFSQGRI